MKNKINFIIISLLTLLALPLGLGAATLPENCYLEFQFQETHFKEVLDFSLTVVQSKYGYSESKVKPAHVDLGETYLVDLLNSDKVVLGSYWMETSRYTIVDHFGDAENPGEEIVSDESMSTAYTNYYDNLAFVRVREVKGTFSKVFPLTDYNLKCERSCKLEGERTDWQADKCCAGLFGVETENSDEMICISCGDGFCSKYETGYSCARDCSVSKESFAADTTPALGPNQDKDNDGFAVPRDCNDNNPLINPGTKEVCDNVDNDCNLQADEGNVCPNTTVSPDELETPSVITKISRKTGSFITSLFGFDDTVVKSVSDTSNPSTLHPTGRVLEESAKITGKVKQAIRESENGNTWLWVLGIIILLIILGVIYSISRKKKNEK